MPDPYIHKNPNDVIRAADWNAIQVAARDDLESHDHSGGQQGEEIGAAGLANGAVTNPKIAALAVTSDKIANGAITQAKLDPDIQLNQSLRILVPAGGDGQIGVPGETLEIALRVRVSDGKAPISDAHVEFAVLETTYYGQALDQYTGGSLLAPLDVISTEDWPNGVRAKRVIVKTNADGVAQVQRVLGTHAELSIQRVQAVLLDEDGQRTREQTLFTAHLAVATQIGWFPHSVFSFLAPSPGDTVQAALDGIASALARLGLGQSSIIPSVIDDADNRQGIVPGYTISASNFAHVELRQVYHGQDLNFEPHPLCQQE